MRTPSPLPEHLAGRLFTLQEQLDAGIHPGRARRADLHIASRGVRVPWGSGQDLAHICRTMTDVCPGTVCCGGTAAQLWGCPLPWALQQDFRIHLCVPKDSVRPVRAGVAGHRLTLRGGDEVMLDGVRVTSPARTWLDLAGQLGLDDLVAVADFLICRQERSFGPPRIPLCSQADLAEQVLRAGGSRGVRNARLALELCRVGADSAQETMMRLALGRLGLPEPTLSYVVTQQLPNGYLRELAWPDLAYPEFKIAVNYDGRHHLELRQRELDIRRDESIAAIGWTSVTITAGQVRERGFDGCALRVRSALIRRGWPIERRDNAA